MIDLESLRKHCKTPRQLQVLECLIRHNGNAARAARELSVSREVVRDMRNTLAKRAGALLPLEAIGEDMRLRGVSTLTPQADGSKQWVKTERASNDPPAFEVVPAGFSITHQSSYVDGQGQVRGQHIGVEKAKALQFAELEAALRASVATYAQPARRAPIARLTQDPSTMALYPLGDPHIGMLAHILETGNDYDLKICERDMVGAMDRLVAGMPASDIGVLIPMGDNFHADDDNQRTPAHHHKVDVDSRSHKVAAVGINIMRRLIDCGLQKHREMHVRVVSGNHDPVTSMWLRLCLQGWYSAEPRVVVHTDVSAMQVWEFGLNMLAVAHGDGIKPDDMPGVMAARHREMWGRTAFHYGYQGHKHKRQVLEKHGALIEVLRTLAGKDSFAAKYGYESGQSAVGIVLHKLYGEIERKTVDVTLARLNAGAAE